MDVSNPITTLVASGSELLLYVAELYLGTSHYHSINGALQYFALTQLDIFYAINNYVC